MMMANAVLLGSPATERDTKIIARYHTLVKVIVNYITHLRYSHFVGTDTGVLTCIEDVGELLSSL